MLAANHTIVAGVVGSYIGNPFLAFLAGFIIHFLLDSIPHFDTTDKGKFTFRQIFLVVADFAIGLMLIFWVIRADISINSPFVWGAFGGMVPDLLDNVPFWNKAFRKSKIGRKFHNFHNLFHSRLFNHKPFLGLLSQYLIIALFIWLYFAR